MFRKAQSIKLTLATIAVLAVGTVGVNSASAAVITWSSVTSATDADVSNSGTLLEAINFGGSAVTVNGVAFVDGTTAGSSTYLTQNYSGIGTWSPSPGLGTIDSIFTTDWRQSTLLGLGLQGLTIGQPYEIQVFAYATGGAGTRTLTFNDGNPANNIMVTYNTAPIVTGTFTADATTQTMNWIESTGTNFTSGYQLRLIPEPASLALLGLGGLVMLRRPHN